MNEQPTTTELLTSAENVVRKAQEKFGLPEEAKPLLEQGLKNTLLAKLEASLGANLPPEKVQKIVTALDGSTLPSFQWLENEVPGIVGDISLDPIALLIKEKLNDHN